MTLGGFTEICSVPRSAQGAEVGQRGEKALLLSLSLKSLVLAPPPGLGTPPQPSFTHYSSDDFIEKFLSVGFSISSQYCLWKQRGTHYLNSFLGGMEI